MAHGPKWGKMAAGPPKMAPLKKKMAPNLLSFTASFPFSLCRHLSRKGPNKVTKSGVEKLLLSKIRFFHNNVWAIFSPIRAVGHCLFFGQSFPFFHSGPLSILYQAAWLAVPGKKRKENEATEKGEINKTIKRKLPSNPIYIQNTPKGTVKASFRKKIVRNGVFGDSMLSSVQHLSPAFELVKHRRLQVPLFEGA